MARRLIEHGVPLVTVYWNGEEIPGGWDLYYRNAQYLPILAPQLDRGFSADGAVSSQDLVTTIYHCLGIATDTELVDALGRPLRLCQGTPIQGVLA